MRKIAKDFWVEGNRRVKLPILLKLTDQEIQDLLSALCYFCQKYPTKGAVETKKAMKRLLKKLWNFSAV
jgi:NTP pyrophosphatase (non-canonical NTP hydrolase)